MAQAKSSMKVVRVQNIPPTQTTQEFRRILSSASGPDIQVQADLVPSCSVYGGHQTAIVKFSPKLPNFLVELAADRVGEKYYDVPLESHHYSFDKNFFGLTQLYHVDPNRDIIADVVAVTGLNGKPFDSWRGEDPRGQMWLQNFFKEDLPAVRTMIYGYNTKWDSKGVATVDEFVASLTLELAKARRDQTSRDRPLVLFGHSFGAIVVARLLSDWKYYDQDSFKRASFNASRAAFLFGAPHRGMDNSDLVEMVHEKSVEHRMPLLRSLGYESIDQLVSELQKFAELARQVKIFSFYEAHLTQRVARKEGESEYSRSGPDFHLVPRESAVIGLPSNLEQRIPVYADHSNIVKFTQRSDPTYQTVLQYLQQLLGISSEIELPKASLKDDKLDLTSHTATAGNQYLQHVPQQQGESWPQSPSDSFLSKPLALHGNSGPPITASTLDSKSSQDSKFAALLHACQTKDVFEAQKVIGQSGSSEITRMTDSRGRLALHHAALFCDEAMIKLLISEDATELIYAKDRNGNTPLHFAAQASNIKALEVLLQASPDPANYILMKNDDGDDALIWATKFADTATQSYLQNKLRQSRTGPQGT